MLAELLALEPKLPLALQQIDVDGSEELAARYGHKVPVLTTAGGEEICHYFLDHESLQNYLRTVDGA
jgi:hypothetical protein